MWSISVASDAGDGSMLTVKIFIPMNAPLIFTIILWESWGREHNFHFRDKRAETQKVNDASSDE